MSKIIDEMLSKYGKAKAKATKTKAPRQAAAKKSQVATKHSKLGTVVATYPIELAFGLDKILTEILGQADSSGAGMGERELCWGSITRSTFEKAKKEIARKGLRKIVLSFS